MHVLNNIIILLAFISTYEIPTTQGNTFYTRMPDIRPTENDDYWCRAAHLGSTYYLTGFRAVPDSHEVHHMILFGCGEPGSNESAWRCGKDINSTPVCEKQETVLFSWAMGAPQQFTLPKGISFRMGKDTPFNYLVLQVHYRNGKPFKDDSNKTDHSIMQYEIQYAPTNKLAGVYLFAADGRIEPHGITTLTLGCKYTGRIPIHPFAYRVHAHSHGILNRARVFSNNKYHLIGSQSPGKPQAFYKVENEALVIKPDDWMEAKCIMENNGHDVISIGPRIQDEMCNFYMMYWVDHVNKDQLYDTVNQYCYRNANPTMYSWTKFQGEQHGLLNLGSNLFNDKNQSNGVNIPGKAQELPYHRPGWSKYKHQFNDWKRPYLKRHNGSNWRFHFLFDNSIKKFSFNSPFYESNRPRRRPTPLRPDYYLLALLDDDEK